MVLCLSLEGCKPDRGMSLPAYGPLGRGGRIRISRSLRLQQTPLLSTAYSLFLGVPKIAGHRLRSYASMIEVVVAPSAFSVFGVRFSFSYFSVFPISH